MTAQEDFNAFLDAQKQPEYDFASMTDAEKQSENFRYTELKLAVVKEQEVKKVFEKVWTIKFQELAVKHDNERVALGQEKQTAEDNL